MKPISTFYVRFFFAGLVAIAPFAFPLSVSAAPASAPTAAPASLEVTTTLGKVRGVARHGAWEFRGLPYAEPLTPQDRWTPAQPAQPWAGVLDASRFGPACPQERRFELTEESLVEDCLTLNVSMPQDLQAGERLPVFVWIHGGGFVGGSSSLYRLDRLAREGRMVVVSLNYRVGALGFMTHPAIAPAANGNLGLEDQRLAMRWVRQHIERFQGDPARITIGGESAGAASVCLHLLSGDAARGLFSQAMAQSGSCLYTLPTLQQSLALDTQAPHDFQKPGWYLLAKELGCLDAAQPGSAAELQCLRAKPIRRLLAAQGVVAERKPPFAFSPVIANHNVPLPGYAPEQVRAAYLPVPLLYGGTRDELRLYVAYDVLGQWAQARTPAERMDPNRMTMAQVRASLARYFGIDPTGRAWTEADFQRIINEYLPREPRTAAQLGSMYSDFVPIVGLNNCGYLHTAKALGALGTIYQWQFADPAAPVLGVGIARGQDPRMPLGAVHSSELNYWFPRLSNTAAIDAPELPPGSRPLARQMVRMLAHFVATGSPRAPGLPAWPAVAEAGSGKGVMRFSPEAIALYDARAAHRCAFWESFGVMR